MSSSNGGTPDSTGTYRQHSKGDEKAEAPNGNMVDSPEPKEGLLAKVHRIWIAKTEIDRRTYMQMFKGAIAPTIAMAAYQATPFAEVYTTIGYLVGIMTILSLPIQPRAKFLQTMLINIIVSCVACCVALLAMYCAVRARINSEGYQGPGTGGPGTSGLAAQGAATSPYNSSASAVAGIWLFVQIYIISAIRAQRPQFTIPSIVAAIFANVSSVYAPQFGTMVQAMSFARKLLIAFLTGFGISSGVNLIVFPLTSRQIVFKEMTGYITLLRGALKANLDYIHSLEDSDMFAPHRVNTAGEEVAGSKEAAVFKSKMQALLALHSKLATDLPFAKREIAQGKLGPDDLQQISKYLRQVMLPTIGLSSMSDVFQRTAERRGWDMQQDMSHATLSAAKDDNEKARIESILEWHELTRRLREPFGKITQVTDQGLEHAGIILQLLPRRKQRDAEDVAGSEPQPGEKGFSAFYNKRSLEFLESKKEMLRAWCSIHDIELPTDFFDDPYRKSFEAPAWMNEDPMSADRQRLRRQLMLCLHLEYLMMNLSRRVYDLILIAEELQASGKLSKTRLVVPGIKRLRKWIMDTLSKESEAHDDEQIDTGNHAVTVYLGQAYKQKKDPEHLAPQNAWERSSDMLRKIAHFFASPASNFGFRVACATMSITVVAFLRDTQTFYTQERLFWSQIMISISMSPSAGQSLRNFLLRIFGTFVAMLLSWIAYYIVDGHTPGIIVFYFVFLHFGVWIVLKRPQIIPVGMISQVTLTLILGYELQVRKIGVAVAQSNGQEYYPIYILGPVRLATVAGGLLLAWIWTIFPYPISEHSQLRQNLSRSLYLLANYYTVMHETVRARLRDAEGDMSSKDSPGFQLEKARHKIFAKSTAVLAGLRAQSGFVRYDLPIGGKFPRKQYQDIIDLMQSTLNFMALVSLASVSFNDLQKEINEEHQNNSTWLQDFRKLIAQANVTSEAVTTLFALMSACVQSGSPLPPYLRVPEPYQLAQKMDELDRDILSVRHIAEPGYSAFAVIQIGTRCVLDDMRKILNGVKGLVGELDFSYHVVSTADSTRNTSEETLTYPKDNGSMKKLD